MGDKVIGEILRPGGERDQFMRGEGFLLYTDFNAQMLDLVKTEMVPPVDVEDASFQRQLNEYAGGQPNNRTGLNEANFGLLVVKEQIISPPSAIWTLPDEPQRLRHLGVTPEDVKATQGKDIFHEGYADKRFTWDFAAGVAAASVHAFVRRKKLSEEQAANLTLGDWADMIGSAWFSRLMHQFAFTHVTKYGTFGQQLSSYTEDSLDHKLMDQFGGRVGTRVLQVRERDDPFDEMTYLTTDLTPQTRQALREAMHEDAGERSSIGCPVARRSARVSQEVFETNPHVQALVKRGFMTARASEKGNMVQVDQEETAIDRTLQLFAHQLDVYDQQYGTPRPVVKPTPISVLFRPGLDIAPAYYIEHERRAHTDVFRRPIAA